MANRDNHYEAAFEAYLRRERLPYIAVDEARRSLVPDGSLKSLDFIVSPPGGPSWLVDVKGRRFPSGDEHQQYWKNWSTRDDLRSLAAWQRHFGSGFCPLLVFAYHLVGSRSPLPREQLVRVSRRPLRLCGRAAGRLRASCPAALRELGHGGDAGRPVPPRGPVARRAAANARRRSRGTAMTATDWQPLPASLEWNEDQPLVPLSWVRMPCPTFSRRLAVEHVLGQASRDRTNSLSWAIVIFCVILGLLVTLSPSRRTTEIKRTKE